MDGGKVPQLRVITGGVDDESREDGAARLEELAARIRAGELHEYVLMTSGDVWQSYWWCSRFNAVGMTALLHDEALGRMKA